MSCLNFLELNSKLSNFTPNKLLTAETILSNCKDYSAAAEFFNNLMTVSTAGENHLQQMVQLREYFLVQHARFKVGVPTFVSEQRYKICKISPWERKSGWDNKKSIN